VEEYLHEKSVWNLDNKQQNMLTYEVVCLARMMVYFGFYNFSKLLTLTHVLLNGLDNREATPIHQTNLLGIPSAGNVFGSLVNSSAAHFFPRSDSIEEESSNKSEKERVDPYVIKTKSKILEILDFIMDVRLDLRITNLLVIYKKEFTSLISSGKIPDPSDLDLESILIQFEDIFRGNDDMKMELDDSQGRQLLRVLLQMSMSSTPYLSSKSLKVLIRHFSQRHELTKCFTQVQLLVSKKEKDNYQIIRNNLEKLKVLVDEAELWVQKDAELLERKHERKSSRAGPQAELEASIATAVSRIEQQSVKKQRMPSEGVEDSPVAKDAKESSSYKYESVNKILVGWTDLCAESDSSFEQRLLRNMGALQVILDLLQVPYNRNDSKMTDIMHQAHKFLQNFCRGNEQNQILLHRNLKLLLHNGLPTVEAVTLTEVFKDNMVLCNKVRESEIQYFIQCIEKGRDVRFLKFLQTIMKVNGQPIKRTQELVMSEIANAGDEVLLFYHEQQMHQFIELMVKEQGSASCTSDLNYHLNLLRLLTICTEGKNVITEMKCHSLLPLDVIVQVITLEDCIPEVKIEYLDFLLHCYIDAEVDNTEPFNREYIWELFVSITEDVNRVYNENCTGSKLMTQYVTEHIPTALTSYFSSQHATTLLKTHGDKFINLTTSLVNLLKCPFFQEPRNDELRQSLEKCCKKMLAVSRDMDLVIPGNLEEDIQTSAVNQQVRKKARQWLQNYKGRKQFSLLTMEVSGSHQTQQQVLYGTDERNKSIINGVQGIVIELQESWSCLVDAEKSLIVNILYNPEALFVRGTKSYKDASCNFLKKIVSHMESKVFKNDEDLMTNLMLYLEMMTQERLPMEKNVESKGTDLRMYLLKIYFTNFLRERLQITKQQFKQKKDRKKSTVFAAPLAILSGEDPFENIHSDTLLVCLGDSSITMDTVQNRLNSFGVTKLVVNTIMNNPSYNVMVRSINLAVAMLNGGNHNVQESIWEILSQPESEPFFMAIHELFKKAQEEIKTSPTGLGLVLLDNTDRAPNLVLIQSGADNSAVDIQDQLSIVASNTEGGVSHRKNSKRESKSESTTLNLAAGQNIMGTPELKLMQPLLRLLQLFCENHNLNMQNYLRNQKNSKNSKNLILETLHFLDCICGITAGGLVLLSLYIHSDNVELIDQCLTTLTEYCQGPCHENQKCIASNESSGIDIVASLIQTELTALEDNQEMAMQLKKTASQTLLAVMESHQDADIIERIVLKIGSPETLVGICRNLYKAGSEPLDGEEEERDENSPREVGHNIYILAHQLASHNKALQQELEKANKHSGNVLSMTKDAIEYYAENTAQIEIVRSDRTLEQIVFPKHEICKHLTPESQKRVYYNTVCDTQGSKVEDFFYHMDSLYEEMLCQRELRKNPVQYFISSNIVNWSSMSFYFAVIINLIVVFFYPFDKGIKYIDYISMWNIILIILFLVTLSGGLWWSAMYLDNDIFKKRVLFIISSFAIVCSILTLRLNISFFILGLIQVLVKCIYLAGALGNRGVFTDQFKGFGTLLKDHLVVYHSINCLICVLGLVGHEFFYALLLIELIVREEVLQNVIHSVTRNKLSIILTACLAIILIYYYSIWGYSFFSGDFLIETQPLSLPEDIKSTVCSANGNCPAGNGPAEVLMERSCDSLLMCLVTVLKDGIKSGGGISDVIRRPATYEPLFFMRVLYDLSFFIVIIVIIIQNLIFGVIIDTFATLRAEKTQTDDMLTNTCFICGLHRTKFENHEVSFKEHCEKEHFMWNYLYFVVHLIMKEKTELTGPESYVYDLIKGHIENKKVSPNLEWFPRLKCMSLSFEEPEQEQNEIKELQKQLNETTGLVKKLSSQLSELRDRMNEQRKLIQRKQLHTTLPTSLHSRFAPNMNFT
jgi:hypothetical protein